MRECVNAERSIVRDYWEVPKPELEAKISAVLGVPWTVPIDVGMVYSYAATGVGKENPGRMFAEYVSLLVTIISGNNALVG